MSVHRYFGKTESLRILYLPEDALTQVANRFSALVIAEAPGHPWDLATYEALAVQLDAQHPQWGREWRAWKPLPGWRTAA